MGLSSQRVWERAHSSDYLRRLFEQHPELRLPDKVDVKPGFEEVLQELGSVQDDLLADAAGLRAYLLEQKARFVFNWFVADVTECLTTAQLGAFQTRFAEASIQLALRAAWYQPEHRSLLPKDVDPDQDIPGLFVLGLGKLGGEDLNFSSDIDLVAFFDRGTFPVNPMQGPGDVAARILKWVTGFLEVDKGQGFLWRVDWRLRPESSSTQLAMSTAAALEYYYFRSMPWHRLAMMKARPVAGDIPSGQAFLQDMERFIWRQNLDFRAIDELAALKEKIDLEHPALKRQRAQAKGVSTQPDGFNLKLGTGGIREIEFFVNALQLIWGGKRPGLRISNTMQALQRLSEEGLVEAQLAEKFTRAYWWLRRHENLLQMQGNQQTHSLPLEGGVREKYAHLAGINDWQEFGQALYRIRTEVHGEFSSLFQSDNEQRDDSVDHIAPVEWPHMSDICEEIVDMWEHGFRGYGLTTSQGAGLDVLYRKLAGAILALGRDTEESIQRVHAYFLRLPPGGQYFRLLQNSPSLIDGLILPLLYSPPMRLLLEQTPHIIDSLLEPDSDLQNRDAFVFHSSDYETRLERMRRLVNEQLYRYYLDFLVQHRDSQSLQQKLTQLAEYSLGMAFRVVLEKLELESAPVCVVGLGKLGTGLLAPLSDLDILYVCSEGTTLEEANRFVHRLQTALATPMKEGVVYEMDTRLRPSGKSGPPTVSLQSFLQYQLERAKTWEHQALVTARSVFGDSDAGKKVMQMRRDILVRPRCQRQLRLDARKMLGRLREQRIKGCSKRIISTKLRKGGLLETEYLVSSATLMLAPENQFLADLNYADLVAEIARQQEVKDLPEILQFWRILQIWERLLGLEGMEVEQIPQYFSSTMFRQLGVATADQLAEKVGHYSEEIVTALDSLLALDDEDEITLSDWVEQPIEWKMQ